MLPRTISVIHSTRPYWWIVGFLPVISYSLYKSQFFPPHDFANYYYAALALKQGFFDTHFYIPHLANQYLFDQGIENGKILFSPNTPIDSILFLPFSYFSISTSKFLFNLFSVTAFSLTLFRATQKHQIPQALLAVVPLLFFLPIHNNIMFGQQYLLLVVLLWEGYWAFIRSKYITSSVLWSIAIFLKIFPVFILGYLCFQKKWKAAIYLSVGIFIFFVSSLLWISFETWTFYIREILPKASRGEVIVNYVSSFQSLYMFLQYIFVSHPQYNPEAIYHNPLLFHFLEILFKGLILGAAIIVSQNNKDLFYNFAFWIVASLLLSPYGNSSSAILFIFMLIGVLHSHKNQRYSLFTIFIILLIANLPVHYFSEMPIWAMFPRLFLILILFGSLVWSLPFYWKPYLLGIVLFLLLNYSRLLKDNDPSTVVLPFPEPTFLYDYQINNNKLAYLYWSQNGPTEKQTDILINSYSQDALTLQQEQIYYQGQQITFTKDHKRKPTIINNSHILYLSDKGKGPFVFGLRKIKLSEHVQHQK